MASHDVDGERIDNFDEFDEQLEEVSLVNGTRRKPETYKNEALGLAFRAFCLFISFAVAFYALLTSTSSTQENSSSIGEPNHSQGNASALLNVNMTEPNHSQDNASALLDVNMTTEDTETNNETLSERHSSEVNTTSTLSAFEGEDSRAKAPAPSEDDLSNCSLWEESLWDVPKCHKVWKSGAPTKVWPLLVTATPRSGTVKVRNTTSALESYCL